MFIELVDSLRCVEPHEDTWLVAAVTRMDGRHIVEGTLGCPICRREYPIADGVAWFANEPPVAGDERLTRVFPVNDENNVLRAAALLGLSDPGGIVALGGSWVQYADAIAELGPGHVVVLNARAADTSPQEVSSLIVDNHLPFARGSLRAAALGREIISGSLLVSAVDVLRSKGRLVAPAQTPSPDGMAVLARDETDWVAERDVDASTPVTLRSARR
jgi:uncharacterized protein YbaR (Trm112 family)